MTFTVSQVSVNLPDEYMLKMKKKDTLKMSAYYMIALSLHVLQSWIRNVLSVSKPMFLSVSKIVEGTGSNSIHQKTREVVMFVTLECSKKGKIVSLSRPYKSILLAETESYLFLQFLPLVVSPRKLSLFR